MTQINRLYASSGSEVIIETLQINIGDAVHYLCKGYEDITATTENGDTVTFIACAMDIALPARNADGTQDLKFALCNIDGVVSTAIRNAINDRNPASLTYRSFISTDLTAPAAVPYTLAIKSRILDGYRGADYRWLHECSGYSLAAISLYAPIIPRSALHQLRNPNV
ncbi:ArsR family transcriptional regulator [Klebsiella michiganensis]|uniref:ArsR family transcriptional regulator n=1 Tax=Klebsiella michiganensis TaxID=1134687 RepID=A0A7H4LWG2_9ENTR|nr:ArsR family transcriptional regulator [Klebsiella michiganensis]